MIIRTRMFTFKAIGTLLQPTGQVADEQLPPTDDRLKITAKLTVAELPTGLVLRTTE